MRAPPGRRPLGARPPSHLLLVCLLLGACTRVQPAETAASPPSGRTAPGPPTAARVAVRAPGDKGKEILVPLGWSWKYLDSGVDPGPGWTTPAFNDEAWPQGDAQLGFGEGDEVTVVGFGPDPAAKPITTYFRTGFDVPDPAAARRLFLRAVHDDGAVVHVNGVEVLRQNLPAGPITAATRSTTATLLAADDPVEIDLARFPGLLRAGRNVLAVEIHQSAPDSPELSFDLELMAAPSVIVTRGPYLQMGGPNQAVIRWRTDVPVRGRAVATARGGGSAPVVVTEPAPLRDHVILLAGLTPETRYDYTIGTDELVLAGQPGDELHHFLTPPLPGTPKPTRIWVIGDSGTADANAAAVYNAYLSTAHRQRPADLWIMLGDNAYWSGTDDEYQRAVFDLYTDLLPNLFLWPTIGNHETYIHTKGEAYLDIFTLPTRAEMGGVASGSELYYSFDHGNIHFVVLDSMLSERQPDKPMLSWLKADLESTDKTWLIAYWHHPPYSKGHHDSDNAAGYDSWLVEMREWAVPILEAHGVDLVLCGHSHTYERSYLLQGHHGLSSTLVDQMKLDVGSGRPDDTGAYLKGGRAPHEGAVFAVAGSSGLLSARLGEHPAMYATLDELGSMVIDVEGRRLSAMFIDHRGKVRDEFAIHKDSPPAIRPPDRPHSLSAAPGNGQKVKLAWRHDGKDETGFVIERAREGEDFAPRHRMGANAADWVDPEVPLGTRLWYRVRATNAAGASDPSNEAGVQLVAPATSDGGPLPNDGGTLPPDATGAAHRLRAAGGGAACSAVPGAASGGLPAGLVPAGGLGLALAARRARRRRQPTTRRCRGDLLLGILLAATLAPGTARAHGPLTQRMAALDREIARQPDNPQLYLSRSILHRENDDPGAALVDLQRASGLAPDLPELHLHLAHALLADRRSAEGRAHLDRAVRGPSAPAAAFLLRGRLLLAEGRPAAAAADFEQAIRRLGPAATADDHLLLFGACRAAGQHGRAARALERGRRQLGPVVTLELAAVDLAVESGRIEVALRRLDGIARTSPRPEAWLIRRGDILQAAGRESAARQAYAAARAALERLPPERRNTPAVKDLLARVETGLARPDRRRPR